LSSNPIVLVSCEKWYYFSNIFRAADTVSDQTQFCVSPFNNTTTKLHRVARFPNWINWWTAGDYYSFLFPDGHSRPSIKMAAAPGSQPSNPYIKKEAGKFWYYTANSKGVV